MEEYANAVHTSGAPLTNCWGFIDGTARRICRPTEYQRECFSGHKRCHILKFQAIVAANGLIANLFGPMEGRRHDAAMLWESGVLDRLQHLNRANGEPLCIYGDSAYPLRPNLIRPFQGPLITDDEQLFNRLMGSARVSVEWAFGGISKLFAFLDFDKNMKLFLQPVGKTYVVGALLYNCHTILYGSPTTAHFGINPPTLQEYLRHD